MRSTSFALCAVALAAALVLACQPEPGAATPPAPTPDTSSGPPATDSAGSTDEPDVAGAASEEVAPAQEEKGHEGHDHEGEEHFPIPDNPMPEEGIGPKIVFTKRAVDFGEVDEGRVPAHGYAFTNEGDQDLVIYRARPSCTCVGTQVEVERIPPGEAAEIGVTYNSRGRSGPDRKRIYVDSNDPREPRITLTLDIIVKSRPHPSLHLLSRTLNLGVVAQGTRARSETEVKNVGDQDLVIFDIRKPPGAKASLSGRARIPPSERGRIDIEVTAPPSPGVARFPFTIASNDPFHEDFVFAALAYVPANGPELRIQPEAARLEAVPAAGGRYEIVIYNRGNEPLELKGASRVDGDERIALELPSGETVPPGGESRAAIVVTGGGEPGSIRSRWKLESNDVRFPERTIDLFADLVAEVPEDRGPRLVVGHGEWNIDVVDTTAAPSHTVTVFNRGDAPLEVTGLKVWGAPHPFEVTLPEPIQPGGSGELGLVLSPGAPIGVLDYVLDVESNDPYASAQLEVSGYLEKAGREFPEGTRRLVILYGSDEAGEIQSCGCGEARLGGIDRATALAQTFRAENPATLVLSAGDVFGPNQPHFRLRATLAAEVLALMGTDAVMPGEGDFSFGRAFLEETLGAAGVPAIATNIVAKEAGEAPFPAVLTKKVGGVDVAVLGLIEPGLFTTADAGLLATDPEVALRERLAEVRPKADLVVLLSHLGRKRTVEVLGEVPGVDVAVIGHAEEGMDEPLRVGRTVVVANGGSGKTLGHLEVGIAPDGVLHAAGRRVPLSEDITPDPRAVSLVEQYKRQLRELPAPEHVSLEKSRFAGSKACKKCHAADHEAWEESGHARAFTSLQAVASEFDPECVGCHVVGWGAADGFVRADLTPDLVDVGCEACHGPGRAHVVAMKADDTGEAQADYVAENVQGVCGGCHTQDRNPGFRYDDFWEKIRHGGE